MTELMDGGFARPNFHTDSVNVPSNGTSPLRNVRRSKSWNPNQYNYQKPRDQKPRVLRVLFVGEESANNTHHLETIDYLGHFAEFACDCHFGLQMASVTQPNFVLLNLNLPINECLQFVKQLRQDYLSNSIFIAGLAYDSGESLHRQCVAAGVDLIIDPPMKSKFLEILLLMECVRLDNLRSIEEAHIWGKNDLG